MMCRQVGDMNTDMMSVSYLDHGMDMFVDGLWVRGAHSTDPVGKHYWLRGRRRLKHITGSEIIYSLYFRRPLPGTTSGRCHIVEMLACAHVWKKRRNELML